MKKQPKSEQAKSDQHKSKQAKSEKPKFPQITASSMELFLVLALAWWLKSFGAVHAENGH